MWVAFAFTLVILSLMLGWLPMLVIAKGLSKDVGSLSALSFNLVGVVGGIVLGLAVDRFPLSLASGLDLSVVERRHGPVGPRVGRHPGDRPVRPGGLFALSAPSTASTP